MPLWRAWLWMPLFVVQGLFRRITGRPFFPNDVSYHANGTKKSEGPFYHGDRQERWAFWYENGQVESVGAYVGGWEDGPWTFWYENGQMMAHGKIGNDGSKEGVWSFWDRDGNAILEPEFLDMNRGYVPSCGWNRLLAGGQ
jgi:hypothetical protein